MNAPEAPPVPPLPRVAVVIAAHDAAAHVDGAIDSALAQAGVDLRILAVDDASRDATAAHLAARAAAEPRLLALGCARNLGPGGARNVALSDAALEGADWVAVLDSDDRLAPNRLARLCARGAETGADVVIDDFCPVDGAGRPLGPPALVPRRGGGPVGLEDWIGLNGFGFREASFGYAKPVIRAEFLRRSGLRYDPALRNGEDFHLLLAALLAGGRIWFEPVPGYLYTHREGSVSRRARPEHLSALAAADAAVADELDRRGAVGALAALRRRDANLRLLLSTEEIMGALKARRPDRAVRALLRHPGAAGRLGRHLGEALQRRMPAMRRRHV
ncbi:glycosyltransferase family 2 protein [Limimaricola pyoseonensis]|uniref:Succinoglycan biosynthesis protein ExoO n=1 Tax=Limimaricola pyoseonensis TaxID=521013 RepID=A0A1G7IZ82_9RHOB|nr:glycosyltransferase [Limimaricola pyoseonensis]SDF17980.1 succinoglycan biosynthesis protein ExoO [Limimaricola pyoseonensis]